MFQLSKKNDNESMKSTEFLPQKGFEFAELHQTTNCIEKQRNKLHLGPTFQDECENVDGIFIHDP